MTRPTETSATPQSGDRKAPLAPRPHRDAPGAALELMQPARQIDLPLLTSILERAFAQTMHMIFVANTRKDKRPGDPKVGAIPRRARARSTSSLHCTWLCASPRTSSPANRMRRRSITRCTI